MRCVLTGADDDVDEIPAGNARAGWQYPGRACIIQTKVFANHY
jgi:hypothetical protein